MVSTALLVGLLGCGSEKTEAQYLSSAKSYIEQDRDDAAIIELKSALRLNSNNPDIRNLLGKIYLGMGNGPAAEKEFRRALANGSHKAVEGVIKSLNIQREYDQLIRFVDELNQNESTDKVLEHTFKAIAYFRLGNPSFANEELNLALEIKPMTRYSRLASAYKKVYQNDERGALNDVSEIATDLPEFIDAIQLQAQLQLGLEEYEGSARTFEKLVSLQPMDNVAKLMLINALVKNLEHEKAEPLIDNLLSFIPNHAYTNQLKGIVRFYQQDFEKSKGHIEKAIQYGLNTPQNRLIAGFSSYNLNHYEQSYNYLVGLTEILPPSHPAMRMLAIVQMKLGYPVEASQALLKIDSFSEQDMQLFTEASIELLGTENQVQISKIKERVKALEPKDAVGFLNKAKFQLSLNDIESVISLEKSLELNANSNEAKTLLATEYLRTNKFDKALNIANLWIADEGQNIEALNIIALANLGLNQEDKAMSAMQGALKIEPNNPLALMYLAEKDIESDNYTIARGKIERLVGAKPNYIPALSTYFYLMNKLKQPELALEKIKMSQELNPKSIPHTMLLAKVYVSQNKTKETINLLKDFPKSHKLPAIYWVSLGNSLLIEGEIDEVKKLYDEWTQLQPKQKLSWIKGAVTAEHTKNFAAGLIIITESLKFIRDDEQLLIYQTHFYIKTNKLAQAQANIDAFSDSIKEKSAVENLQGKIWAKQGEYEKALGKLQIGYKAVPNSKNAGLIYNVYKALNETDKAESFALIHVKKHPKDLFMQTLLANNYSITGNSDKAFKQYRKIVELFPNNVVALNNLAWIELENNNLGQAAELGDRVLKLAPLNPSVLDTVASIKLALGKKEDGIALLRKANELAPQNKAIQQHLKEALK